MAYNATSDACGAWVTYSLEASEADTPQGSFIDEPVIGQDRDAFLFGGASYNSPVRRGKLQQRRDVQVVRGILLPEELFLRLQLHGQHLPVFHRAHYAAPASSGGSPMITTTHSYFVASLPSAGYELYRMDNSGTPGGTTFALHSSFASAQATAPPTRDAGQPGTQNLIELEAEQPNLSTRIASSPTFDGTRIWFTHVSTAGDTVPHPRSGTGPSTSRATRLPRRSPITARPAMTSIPPSRSASPAMTGSATTPRCGSTR
jgi:hypothetical protein